MARGQSLLNILNRYRSEARISLNAAHNVQMRESQILLLQRTQERLWQEFDWPHMFVERNYALADGVRFYDVSDDFDMERINWLRVKINGQWQPLSPSLEACDYLTHDSELNAKAWPPYKWRVYENDQIEIWPVPDRAGTSSDLEGYLKVRGVKKLAPFVADTDHADLDDVLIALFAAAETLASTGAKDAAFKLEQAKTHQGRLQGRLSKRRRISMFGIASPEPCGNRRRQETYKPPA